MRFACPFQYLTKFRSSSGTCSSLKHNETRASTSGRKTVASLLKTPYPPVMLPWTTLMRRLLRVSAPLELQSFPTTPFRLG